MEDSQQHDADDLAGVIAGDPHAIDRWYRRDHPAVWRLAFGLLGERAEADDLAQDAMLQLHDKLTGGERPRSYRAWRDTLVLNLCRDRARRRASRRHAEAGAGGPRALELAPASSAPLERSDVQRVLRVALEALPERERAAFVLRELEGHSTAHVAAVLEIGESSVRSLLTLARRRLRDLLGDRLDPRPLAAREGRDG
ncbi:MAG: RNA polymerase sigma factor [Planctomycetes bacterium]|nr:RNA polymerase sigma factor [Planctomycetota bacterium]MCB9903296.1 RNA polymerase sigma factor [Planctomycetota bacterium]